MCVMAQAYLGLCSQLSARMSVRLRLWAVVVVAETSFWSLLLVVVPVQRTNCFGGARTEPHLTPLSLDLDSSQSDADAL